MRGLHAAALAISTASFIIGISSVAEAQVAGRAPSAPAADERGGMKAYLDPSTGKLTDTPPAGVPVPRSLSRRSSGPALREEQGPTAAGGVNVNLDERFTEEVRAEAKPAGGATVHCVPHQPDQGAK